MYGKQENDGEQLGNSRKSQEEEIYKEAEFLRSYVGYEILDDVADNFNGNTERGNEKSKYSISMAKEICSRK